MPCPRYRSRMIQMKTSDSCAATIVPEEPQDTSNTAGNYAVGRCQPFWKNACHYRSTFPVKGPTCSWLHEALKHLVLCYCRVFGLLLYLYPALNLSLSRYSFFVRNFVILQLLSYTVAYLRMLLIRVSFSTYFSRLETLNWPCCSIAILLI